MSGSSRKSFKNQPLPTPGTVNQCFFPPPAVPFRKSFRNVFWKSLGLTVLMLIAFVVLLQNMADSFIAVSSPWVDTAIAFLTGIGLLLGAGFLIAPVMSVFAGLFLDDISEAVEARDYPQDEPGAAMPVGRSIILSARFLLLVVAVNIVAPLLNLLTPLFATAFMVHVFKRLDGKHQSRVLSG